MVIKFDPDVEIYNLYINVENLTAPTYDLVVKSQFSNDFLLEAELTTVTSNERYTHFSFEPEIDLKNDIGGIYEYIILENENIIDAGLIKIVNVGNELETKSYISNNETRKSRVLYRPKDNI